ncbi:putative reverse transcriptase domain-containing protein [Tanacetum coccineum]
MAASAIAISSDSSDESVGSPPSRVILFGDIPTVIPSTSVVAPETSTIAPVISSAAPVVETTLVASPTGLCGLVPYSGSDSDSPDEMSRVTTRPSSSSEFPIAPIISPPGIRRWSAILIRPGEAIPFGRPYRIHLNGSRKLLTVRKRVGTILARRLASRHVSPRYSDHRSSSSSSSSDSSPVHSSGLDVPDQAHSGSSTRDVSPRLGYRPRRAPRRSEAFRHWCAAPLSTLYPPTTSESSSGDLSERPLHSSSHSARPSRKRCRSPIDFVPSSTPVMGSLAPTHADLLPPRKRFRDSYSSEADIEDDTEIDPIETEVDMKLGIGDGNDVRDHVEIDPRDFRDDTEGYEVDTSAGDTVEVGIDPMSAPIVEEEIVEPAREDSSDSSGTRDGIVRSFKDMPIDLDDDVRDFYHHMFEVRIDRIVGIETAQKRLDNLKVCAMLDIERDRVNNLRLHMSISQEEFCQVRRDRDDTQGRLKRKMTITRSGMTPEVIKELVNRRVEEALAAHEATRAANALETKNQSQNGSDGDNGNGGNGNGRNEIPDENGRGDRPVARECTYQDFMNNCPEKSQVKYATCTPLDNALTWNEIQKRETELWNLTIKNNDLTAYTQRFQELTMMCTKMVPEEEVRVEKFIGGLPDNIQGNVIAAEPTRLQDAVRIANNLMDQKLKGCAVRNAKNKKRLNNNYRNNHGQQPPNKRQNIGGQNVTRAYMAGNNEKNGYEGTLPFCNRIVPKSRTKNRGNKARVPDARGKAYVLGGGDANPGSNTVTGMFLLNDHHAYMLFDSGADRSFVSNTFSALLDIIPSALDVSYAVELADGRTSETNTVLRGCTLGLLGCPFNIDLMPIDLGSFNVIIGMDWLAKNHAVIVCDEKITMGKNNDEAGSSQSKRSRHETMEEVLLPQVHHEFLLWEGCNRDAKSRYNTRLAQLLPRHIYSPCIVHWDALNQMDYDGEIDDMLRIRVREAESDEEIFTLVAWIRDFNINELIYAELCHEFYSTYEFDEVCADDELQTKKIIKFRLGGRGHNLTLLEFARRLGLYQAVELGEDGFNVYFEGGLRNDNNFNAQDYWLSISRDDNLGLSRSHTSTIRRPILRVIHKMITYGLCQRTTVLGDCKMDEEERSWDSERESNLWWYLDSTTLRDLIDSDGKLIPEDPQPGVPRVGIPRPPRASMQDLYDRIGRMEIRQDAIERDEYRRTYH